MIKIYYNNFFVTSYRGLKFELERQNSIFSYSRKTKNSPAVTCIIISKITFIIFKIKIIELDFGSEYLTKIDYLKLIKYNYFLFKDFL